ncbi:hypothetical protein T4D_12254, partial [Trichinella pseudospiralis]
LSFNPDRLAAVTLQESCFSIMQIWANSNRVYMLCDQRLRRVTAVDVKETIFRYKEWNKQKVKTQRTTRSRTSEVKRTNPLKTGFWRCTMQITIAIKVQKAKRRRHEANLGGHLEEKKEMRRERYRSEENSSENLDDRKWIADGTKQVKRKQEVCGSPWVPVL